jgi:hypothetical protein
MDCIKETRNLLWVWLQHERKKLSRLRLADAAARLARRARRFDALLKGKRFDPSEPRDPDGRWTEGGGGGGHGAGDGRGAGKPSSGKPARHERPKALKAAARYRDLARRRKVIAAVKVEGELSDAIGGHNLEDSLPFDAVFMLDAAGKPVVGRENVRRFLRAREVAGRVLSRQGSSPDARRAAERVLSLPCEFFEVKTLLTSRRHAVHMSKQARARKERWAEKYHGGYSLVAVDRRRGSKRSPHEIYVSPGELSGTHRLEHMRRADSFAHVLTMACPSCKEGR